MTAASVHIDQPHPPHSRSAAISQILAWSAVIVLLVANIPLFLCMPIIDDAALYDLQAANLLHGGVTYRDTLEPNLPGVIWIHAAVRGTLGYSSIALRAVDLGIFGVIVLLLLQILKDLGASCLARSWTGAVCLLFYVSISEWCHCQRDMWLMGPSLAWLWLRGRQVQRLAPDRHSSASQVFRWSFIEGLVLGVGIWIKPMIIVPATAAWLVGACGSRRRRLWHVDAAGLGLGGLLVGGAGFVWLWCSGAWPYFWDTMLHWNPRYVAAGKTHWTLPRFAGMCVRLFPWLLLHVPAVLRGRVLLIRLLRRRVSEGRQADVALRSKSARAAGTGPDLFPTAVGSALEPDIAAAGHFHRLAELVVGAFYIGWLAQAFFLQHLFDYVHAPGVLLAILISATIFVRWRSIKRAVRISMFLFLAAAVLTSPAIRPSRLQYWADCWRQGSSPAMRDRLRQLAIPEWRDLERVAGFLRDRNVQDGDLCCLPNSTVHLYAMLEVRPPTKYVFLESYLVLFPDRKEEILAALAVANPKYAVTDLVTAGVPPDALSRIRPGAVLTGKNGVDTTPGRIFPWASPIVFRAGRYAVHRTDGPIRSLELMPDLPLPRARAWK